jgi:hypothetical protein
MAAPAKKVVLTAADIGRFLIIAALGFLASVTFLVAGTIAILMAVETSGCKCFVYTPVGLFVLGVFGLCLLVGIIIEAVDAPEVFQNWYGKSKENREMLILGTISLVAVLLVLR